MRVGIDVAGQQVSPFQIDDGGVLRQGRRLGLDAFDASVAHHHRGVFEDLFRHAIDHIGVGEDEGALGTAFERADAAQQHDKHQHAFKAAPRK